MGYTYEELISAVKKLAEQIAILNIDNALLQAQLNTAKARIKELEEQEVE